MAGLTNFLFQPGDFCYIVLYTTALPPRTRKIEFLEGLVANVDRRSVPVLPEHPIRRYYQTPPKVVCSIVAKVQRDPYAEQRSSHDLINFNEEPPGDYIVIPPLEHERYLQRIIHLQAKVNHIQLARIQTLEQKLTKAGLLQRK